MSDENDVIGIGYGTACQACKHPLLVFWCGGRLSDDPDEDRRWTIDAIRLTVYDPTLRHRHRGKRCPFCGMTITDTNFVTIEERAA